MSRLTWDRQTYIIDNLEIKSNEFMRYYINGLKTTYLVNVYGDIYSEKNKIIRKPETTNKGYFKISLHVNGKEYRKYPHRMVMETYTIYRLSDQTDVNHIDGDKKNNHISNLEWSTRSENIRHAYKTGLKIILLGEENSNSKYTDKQIRDASILRSFGLDLRTIAYNTGIQKLAVRNFLNGNAKSRKYIVDQYSHHWQVKKI